MRALAFSVMLLLGCVGGEDQNNCLPISCNGCCTPAGICKPGTADDACGKGAGTCSDCKSKGQECVSNTQACGSSACPPAQCKGNSGTCHGCTVGLCTKSPSGECGSTTDGVTCCGPGTADCGSGKCNTGTGTSTPCCPTLSPCASGNSCFSRIGAPAGAKCCP